MSFVVEVPDVLGGDPVGAEELIDRAGAVPSGRRITLRLGSVRWVCPYGAVMLAEVCRYLHKLSGAPVDIEGLQPSVHAYLRRVDFWEAVSGVARVRDLFDERDDLARSQASYSVLELTRITCAADIYAVSRRTRSIVDYWLGHTLVARDADEIVTLLAETCSNVVDHSGDRGVVAIQKYERSSGTEVHLAISDLGQGIRRSLMGRHGDIATTCAGYIEQALAGWSARHGRRGGQGLGAVKRIVTTSGGVLLVRSETGCLLVSAAKSETRDNLGFFPGTQVAITFRSCRRPD